MKGCRALSDEEIQRVLEAFRGKNALRNRCLVLLGISRGLGSRNSCHLRSGCLADGPGGGAGDR